VLVHCSANCGRTGAVVSFLQVKGAPGFREAVENRRQLFHGGRGPGHFLRVTDLAVRLYDRLEPKHQLPPRFRTVLWAAAMLHDIGTDSKLQAGRGSHAWRSADKILDDGIACEFASAPEIATVASLHRGEGGTEHGVLGEVYERVLKVLGANAVPAELLKIAAILRVADSLDRYAPTTITGLRLEDGTIVVEGTGSGFLNSLGQALKKSGLLVETLGVSVQEEPGLPDSPGTKPDFARPKRRRAPSSLVRVKPSRVVLFDLMGTLIHHETNQALPMMPFVLQRLAQEGNRIATLTRYAAETARALVADAGLPRDLLVFAGSDRGDLIRQALAHFDSPEKAWYFDDKPEGLAAARRLGAGCLEGRVFGFVGSRRYRKRLATWCRDNRTPLALGPHDIVQILDRGTVFHEFCLSRRDAGLSAEEVGFLLPGLPNPCLCFSYEDRAIGDLYDAAREDWTPIWRNLGWIGVAHSAFILLAESAKRVLGLAVDLYAKGTEASAVLEVVNGLPDADRANFKALAERIHGLMQLGIEELGPCAEDCRPAGEGEVFRMDKDRMTTLRESFLDQVRG